MILGVPMEILQGEKMGRKIMITKKDKEKLQKIIDEIIEHKINGKEHVRNLMIELENAQSVGPECVPSNIVTMNSTVLLSIGDLEEEPYTLVYPVDADLSKNRISVLAPIGTAILGYKEGDKVKWNVPNGIEVISIIKILYQPESSEDCD